MVTCKSNKKGELYGDEVTIKELEIDFSEAVVYLVQYLDSDGELAELGYRDPHSGTQYMEEHPELATMHSKLVCV